MTKQVTFHRALALLSAVAILLSGAALEKAPARAAAAPAVAPMATSNAGDRAASWAERMVGRGSEYRYWCLKFALDSWSIGAGVSVSRAPWARNYWDVNPSKQHPGDRNAPRGAIVLWNWYGTLDGEYRNWGHAAVSDGDGSLITSPIGSSSTVRRMSFDSINSILGGAYVGWIYPSGSPTSPPKPGENGTGDRLQVGQGLIKGRSLTSQNGYYTLAMQGDGNLVLYRNPGKALWATHTVGRGNHLILQGDGNLVLYGTSTAVWSSKTVGAKSPRLVVQNDGNLVLYSSSGARWASNTMQPANQLGSFDGAAAAGRLRVHVRGWAMDADAPKQATRVRVQVGSTKVGELTADTDRPDVGKAYPAFGSRHGFDGVVTVPAGGVRRVCVYAVNKGRGSDQKLGCKDVHVASTSVPSAPGLGEVVVGAGAALVQWSSPANNGGASVTGYQVVADPGGATCSAGARATHCVVESLANGTRHTFRVRARNSAGWSAWSDRSEAATPAALRESGDATACARADTTGDGRVGVQDLSTLLSAFGTSGGPIDLNGDGAVDVTDLSILLGAWGACPARGEGSGGSSAAPAPGPSVAPNPGVSPTSTAAPEAARVKARAAKARSKLRVNVNPNRGKGYWKLKVQRQRADGTWKTLRKSYRTRGRKEVRTINLRKGTYRVRVKPKFGYAGAVSREVSM